MIKHGKIIVFAVIIIAILSFFFFWNGNTPAQQEVSESNESITDTLPAEDKSVEIKEDAPPPTKENIYEKTEIEKPQNVTKDTPQETEKTSVLDNNITCSLTVRCDDILKNLQFLNKDKVDIVPKDGKIYENKNAIIYEGESVFNVLSRELKKNKIHFEFTKTPMYNSAYIEGIGNLYERDCGELSGWLYKVNGQTPSLGCSQYILNNGDIVEFIYSCNPSVNVE